MTLLFQHISMELLMRYIFMGLIFLPLPVLLFHGIITSVFLEVRNRERYRNVIKYYEHIELLTLLQLQQLYPNKNEETLENMLQALTDRSNDIKYKLETRIEKNREKTIDTIKKIQPEKAQIYPVTPVFINRF